MKTDIKGIINLILAALSLAMGVAVIVLSIVDNEVTTKSLIMMLGIAAASLGLLALNKLPN